MDVVQLSMSSVVCRHMYIHFVNLIVTQQRGETPLHHAAESGNAEVVNILLKAGSKVDEKDKVSMLCKYVIELCILHACINTMTRTTMPM